MSHECAAVGGMRIGRGKRSTRIKPAVVPQISVGIQGISFFPVNIPISLLDIYLDTKTKKKKLTPLP
jgi:hypothetical protein